MSLFRSVSDESVLLLRSTGVWEEVPTPAESVLPLSRGLADGDPGPVGGLRFEVLDHAALGPAVPAQVVVVPWGYDEACNRTQWTARPWVGEGEEAVFFLPPEQLDASRDPWVLHVLAPHRPYPQAHLAGPGRPGVDGELSDWLTAPEFFDLSANFPLAGDHATTEAWAAAGRAFLEDRGARFREAWPARLLVDQLRWSGGATGSAGGRIGPGYPGPDLPDPPGVP